MNPEQWLSLKWNGGSTMSDRWLNQSKIIQDAKRIKEQYVPGFLEELNSSIFKEAYVLTEENFRREFIESM